MSGRRAPGALAAAAAACLVAQAFAGAQKPGPPRQSAEREGGAVERLRQTLLAETIGPNVRRAVWGIVVHSLDKNERLLELNPQTLFVPASTAKVVSALTAADAVGWDYTFETKVFTTAPIRDG